jgi:hypothetical protein
VRATIDDALRRGTGDNPEGSATDWRLLSAGPSDVMREEREHAARLVRS